MSAISDAMTDEDARVLARLLRRWAERKAKAAAEVPPQAPRQADTPASVVRPAGGGEGNASARRGGGVTSEDYRP
jgi:hypothetical protein